MQDLLKQTTRAKINRPSPQKT